MSIKQRRLAKGWTQDELALHSGISARTIQRVESGQSVGSETLKCLAAVFETSVKHTENTESVTFNESEKSAIKYGQSLLQTPKKGESDPSTRIEREAIDYGKSLLSKLKQKKSRLTSQLSGTANSLLGSTSLHILANYYQPLIGV